MFAEVIETIKLSYPQSQEEVKRFFNTNIELRIQECLNPNSDEELVVQSIFIIGKCIEERRNTPFYRELMSGYRPHSDNEAIDIFIEECIKPITKYIEEQIADTSTILNIFLRYKHRSEWFHRDYLYDLWKNNTNKGEKNLALNLYEYLFDQGVEFTIEPSSASGEPDMVSSQSGKNCFVADAKIFKEAKDKNYLAKGLSQIYTYTKDYNQPFGYLVVYKTCESDLELSLSGKTITIPFIQHNNKTIYIITIDIHRYKNSASKRETIKPIRISEKDLIQSLEEESEYK